MKIITKENTGLIAFKNLKTGSVFRFDGITYLKISPLNLEFGVTSNCVRLVDGLSYGLSDSLLVLPLPDAELHC